MISEVLLVAKLFILFGEIMPLNVITGSSADRIASFSFETSVFYIFVYSE